jgi:hypothetical protein
MSRLFPVQVQYLFVFLDPAIMKWRDVTPHGWHALHIASGSQTNEDRHP